MRGAWKPMKFSDKRFETICHIVAINREGESPDFTITIAYYHGTVMDLRLEEAEVREIIDLLTKTLEKAIAKEKMKPEEDEE